MSQPSEDLSAMSLSTTLQCFSFDVLVALQMQDLPPRPLHLCTGFIRCRQMPSDINNIQSVLQKLCSNIDSPRIIRQQFPPSIAGVPVSHSMSHHVCLTICLFSFSLPSSVQHTCLQTSYCVFSSACKGDIYNIGVHIYIKKLLK